MSDPRSPKNDIESYEVTAKELASPVDPSVHLQHAKEGNAFRLARGLILGLGFITFFILIMLALNTYGTYNKKSVDVWREIIGHVKEVTLFVIGAMAGYWFSK